MGILNVTPDSFSDGGNYVSIDKAVVHAKQMVVDGADIIDIGGESTRPGAIPITLKEELARVIPVIKCLKEEINIPISIDTYKAEVARQAIEAGASMINDIGGAKLDSNMPKVMAESGVKVILMHHKSHAKEGEMKQLHNEVIKELRESVELVTHAGVSIDKIIIDPGIGFGKSMEQNTKILKHLDYYQHSLELPILLGVSKKRIVRELMESDDLEMLSTGTIATTCYAYTKGINYIRVHDVKATKIAINVMKNLK
jgi:dihydropteroate synthase